MISDVNIFPNRRVHLSIPARRDAIVGCLQAGLHSSDDRLILWLLLNIDRLPQLGILLPSAH